MGRTLLVPLHPNPKAQRIVDAATVLLFAGALLAPLVDERMRPVHAREPLNENRDARPSPEPPQTLAQIETFPVAFEAHHADTFGLRDVFLRWNSVVKMGLWRVPPTPTVVYDRSGWLDYAGERTFEVLRGVEPLSKPQVDAWTTYLALCNSYCRRHGAKYLYVAVPNKETVYQDHVPDRYRRLGPSRFDQIVASLPDSLRSAFLDLRPVLSAARKEDTPGNYLYFENGTHWNGRGGWVAYQAVMRALSNDFPTLHALTDMEVGWQVDPDEAFDSWGPRLYQPDAFKGAVHMCLIEGPQRWQEVESDPDRGHWHARNPTVNGPRVLVISDSFGPAFYTLFASTFPEVDFVQSGFDPVLVEKERPDVVVELRVERMFTVSPLYSIGGKQQMEAESQLTRADVLALSVDPAGSEALMATGNARVERTSEGIAFSADTAKDGWILPAFDVAATDRAWLHIEIQSATPGTLVAWRREGEDGPWLRREATQVRFSAGTHVHDVPLPGPPGRRQVRLGFFGAPAHVIVQRLEVRTTGV